MLTTFLVLAGVSQPAWSFDVHRLVCDIAWREMRAATREAVTRLLATERPAESFPEACTWADRVRREAGYRWTAPAHYVNLPRGAPGLDVARDCDTICVVTAIPRFAALLGDWAQPDSVRREALKFVAHFVGDLHQPLHAGYGDDLGGNRTAVRFQGDSLNVHALWDGRLADALGIGPGDGARLHAAIAPVDRALWLAASDPATWANESFAIVERQVYADLDGGMAGHDYAERNRHAVTSRIQAAGVRLAAVLDRTLTP